MLSRAPRTRQTQLWILTSGSTFGQNRPSSLARFGAGGGYNVSHIAQKPKNERIGSRPLISDIKKFHRTLGREMAAG